MKKIKAIYFKWVIKTWTDRDKDLDNKIILSRLQQKLFDLLTQLRKEGLIDDTHKQQIRKNIQNKIKINTWEGNRHKRNLPLKGSTTTHYKTRKIWRP